MYTDEVVRLNIMSWVGSSSIGASYYYAKLQWRDADRQPWYEHELEYTLDNIGAQRLTDSEPDDAPLYKASDITSRFLCPDRLRQEALGQWRKVVPHGKVLLECDIYDCGPVEILAGPRKLVRLGNQVWKKWAVSEANDKLCVQLESQWEALFKKAGFSGLTDR